MTDNRSLLLGETLMHYGVPGMRWGKRKARDSGGSSGGSDRPSRGDLREMNRTARAENKAAASAQRAKAAANAAKATNKRDRDIINARGRLEKEAVALKEAKKQYKTDKKEIGRVAAKRIVSEHRNKFYSSLETAGQDTSKEATAKMLQDVGGILAASILEAAAARR